MIPRYDIPYSLRREAEERRAAQLAMHAEARIAHTVLADRYADRAWAAREAQCEDLKC